MPESLSIGWAGILYSAVFSLVAAYVIWYTAVRELGSGHTAIYQNVVPIVAMIVATLVLHEPTTAVKVYGAIAVLAGVVLTRLESADVGAFRGLTVAGCGLSRCGCGLQVADWLVAGCGLAKPVSPKRRRREGGLR